MIQLFSNAKPSCHSCNKSDEAFKLSLTRLYVVFQNSEVDVEMKVKTW